MQQIAKVITISFLVTILLCSCSKAGGENWVIGTVLNIDTETVVVAPTDSAVNTLTFPTTNLDPSSLSEIIAGDEIVVVYTGTLPQIIVRDCALNKKQLSATVLEITDTYAIVKPTTSDSIAPKINELYFSVEHLDDKGIQVGDTIELIYVRDIVPGSPPRMDVRDWGIIKE